MAAPTPDPLELEGYPFGERYRIEEYLASGGIAAVYRAADAQEDRLVAIKVLDARTVDPERADEMRERFQREAEACMRLQSPHIARIYEHGSTPQGFHFMVLEWLEGETFHDRMRREGTATPASLIHVIKQLCLALAEAHEHGIVHRDLKPGNVLIVPADDGGNFVKLIDFGLAKHIDSEITLTRAGSVMGTPTYMAPEQIEGAANVDHRADIYSVGVMLFRGLTNKRPFGGRNAAEVMSGHLRKPVPSISTVAPDIEVPRNLEWVIRTCLNKTREDRFDSADELRLALTYCELELEGKLDEQRDLTAVGGRMDIDEALRSQLVSAGTQPAPTPAPVKRRPSQRPPKKRASVVPVVVGLGLGGMGMLILIATMAYALM